jgi:WD40 repeat protein
MLAAASQAEPGDDATMVTLADLGWDDDWAAEADGHPLTMIGQIVRQDRGWVQVATRDGVVAARTRQDRVGTPVVGDWIVLDDEPDDLEIFSHMMFSPDGDLLAMHTLQDELSVWDWRKGREVARPGTELHRLAGFGFLPGGCGIAAVAMEPEPRPGDEYRTPIGQRFDLAAGTTTGYGSEGSTGGTLSERPPAANGLAVSPNGLVALTGSAAVPGAGVQIVDSRSGETAGTIDSDGEDPVFLDERRLALANLSGSTDWSVTVWDAHTGERLHTVRPVADGVFAPVPGADEIVYVDGGEVIVWDVVAGQRVDAFDMAEVAELQEPWIRDVVVDPWLGRVYVMWWDSGPEDYGAEPESHGVAWDLESGENVLPEGLAPWHVAPHPDGEIVAVKTEEPGVRFLDPQTWEAVGTL